MQSSWIVQSLTDFYGEKENAWTEETAAAHRQRPKGSHAGPLFLLLPFVDALRGRREYS